MAPKMSKVKTTIVLIFQVIAVSASMPDCQTHCKGLDGRDLCVTADLMCNHEADCINSEDEDPVLCACGSLRCIGNCLDAFIRCNGVSNCLDHSDEINCTKSDYKHKFPALHGDDLCKMPCGRRGSCSFDSDNKAVCVCDDGYSGVSCENELKHKTTKILAPVEEGLTESSFSCEQSPWVKLSSELFCDGEFDCLDATDEINCTLKDYENAHPELPKRSLCLMPCIGTDCAFDESQKAYCPCPENFEGVFCERPVQTRPEYLTSQDIDDMIRASREGAIDPEQSSTYPEYDSNDSRSFWLMMAFIVLLCGMLIRCYGICFGSESEQIRKSSVSWIKTAARVTYIYTPTKPLDSDESMTKPPV